VQRDEKVELNAYFWMSNHPHIIVRVKDTQAATRFYGEIKKQLTEALKR
jgi:REP element-mobilizing transposase RayT